MLPASTPNPEATRFIRHAGYEGCIELQNDSTRVVLEPNVGGRVISYSLKGAESLYQDRRYDGLLWDGGANITHPSAGRWDIGPEYNGPQRKELWFGMWTAEITGPRAARMTSRVAAGSGLQAVRDFALSPDSSRLRCTQTIRNCGREPMPAFHWSRTFLPGNGIVLAPLPVHGKFPRGYALGGPPGVVQFLPPEEPNLRVRDKIQEILGPPSKAKFLLDVEPGWLGYVSRLGLLFLKSFPVYPQRAYGELAANNASIWYSSEENTPNWPGAEHVVEVEAIGPRELLLPGDECSFTEEWLLATCSFPDDLSLDLRMVQNLAAAPVD
jgi:hypothetical protein